MPDSSDITLSNLSDRILRHRMWYGTLTSYLNVGMRLVKSLFITKILLFHLSMENYGFWTLLWSIFSFMLLFEFGFGRTIQKYAAEYSVTGNVRHFSRIIQVVLTSYLGIAFLLVIICGLGTWLLPQLLKLPVGEHRYYQLAFLVAGLGCTIVFPTAVVAEILVGMQRLHYRNWILMLNHLLELVGIWLIFRWGGSLLSLSIFVPANNLLANLLMLLLLKRVAPEISIRPGRINVRVLREITDFSVFIYFTAIAKVLLYRGAPLVLGSLFGMTLVALHQLGTRVPEMMQLGTSQFQGTLAPTAAMFQKSGRKADLQQLLITTQRLSVYLGLCGLAVFLPTAPAILQIWLKIDDPIVISITQLMLANTLLLVAFKETPYQFLQMTGHHRLLAWSTAAECAAFFVISITLTKLLGVIGMAHGAFWSNTALILLVFLPASIKYAGINFWHYISKIYLPPLLAVLPIMILSWHVSRQWQNHHWTLPELMLAMMTLGIACLISGWYVCLTKLERQKITAVLTEKIASWQKE